MTDGGPIGAGEVRPSGLRGERVVFTGRLASLDRDQAGQIVAGAGGQVATAVGPRTTMVVVGMKGWPLLESGRVSKSLGAAESMRERGHPVKIVSEQDFREMAGLDPAPARVEKSLDAAQVARALGIDRKALDRWAQLGLVRPHDGRYDFQDLVSLKTVTDLVARGVSPIVIRQSLEGLARVVPGAERPLAQLRILVSDSGGLVAELEDALLTPGGQLELRFDRRPAAGSEPADLSMRAPARGATEWAEVAMTEENRGNLPEAERAYRRAIARDPGNATLQLNLGNVLLARGRAQAAAERFAQAAALDPSNARAWYNLAYAQDETGRRRAAAVSLRRALRADPSFADAYYNLAELSERLGRAEEAQRCWREYLRLDPGSESAAEARRRLSARSATWP
jgi:tetratricopeptide (TPR) repeat protein